MPSQGQPAELEILRRLPRLRLVVWGDFVADEFITGEIARVSREAPVLILKQPVRSWAPGGGANAAANLAALGIDVRAVGLVGRDPAGAALLEMLGSAGVDLTGVARPAGYITPTKTRILAHHAHTAPQQVVRLDHEPAPLDAALQTRLAAHAARAARGASGLLLSDYGYGAVAPSSAGELRRRLPARAVMAVDARYQIAAYRGLDAATPNEAELEAALGVTIAGDARRLAAAGRRLRARLGCRHLLVTLGRHGMALFESGRPMRRLGVFGADQALDVTGAGDTVIAVYTACLAAGADAWQAARLANCAGGLVVMKRGTATVALEELAAAVARL